MMDIYFICVHFQNHRMHNTKKTEGFFNLENYCWRESALEKVMGTHSSTLAWQIPWMEEPGGLQSMGSLGVGHD